MNISKSKQIIDNKIEVIDNIYPGHSSAGLELSKFFKKEIYLKIIQLFEKHGYLFEERNQNILKFIKNNKEIISYVTTNNWDNSKKDANSILDSFKIAIPVANKTIKREINIRTNNKKIFIFSPYVPLKKNKNFDRDSFDFDNIKFIIIENKEILKVFESKSATNNTNRWIKIDDILKGYNNPRTVLSFNENDFFDFIDNNNIEEITKKIDDFLSNTEKRTYEKYVFNEYLIRNQKAQKEFRNKLVKEVEGKQEIDIKYQDMLDIIERFEDNVTPNLLIASHIKDFKYSEESEAFDENNGLLLPSFIDVFFDKKLISFDKNNGKIILSNNINKNIPSEIIEFLTKIRINEKYLNEKRKEKLKWHNDKLSEN